MVGYKSYFVESHLFVMIYLNLLNLEWYVVINSGHMFYEE